MLGVILRISYLIPPHPSDNQSHHGQKVKYEVVVEWEGLVAVDGEREQHRAEDGGESLRESGDRRRDAVELPSPLGAGCVIHSD